MRNIASLRYILGLMILPVSLAIGTSVSWAIVVTNTANSGAGSLKQAILDANADGVPTAITFDPAVFLAVIVLTSRLPALTDQGDVIDGGGDLRRNGAILDGSSLFSNRKIFS